MKKDYYGLTSLKSQLKFVVINRSNNSAVAFYCLSDALEYINKRMNESLYSDDEFQINELGREKTIKIKTVRQVVSID